MKMTQKQRCMPGLRWLAPNRHLVRSASRNRELCLSMKRFLKLIGEQSSRAIFAESLLFAIGVGVLDYVSGYEVSMFVFYGIPILAVAWWCGRRSAFALAAICALLWTSADALNGHFYRHQWIRVWEPLARFGYFGFVAAAGSALKRQHVAVQSRITLLEHSQRLERQIIEISEREQRRVGRDLHDGLCQYFAAVGCASASLRSDLAAGGIAEEAAVAAEVTEMIEQGVAQIRDLARGLMPVQMYRLALPRRWSSWRRQFRGFRTRPVVCRTVAR